MVNISPRIRSTLVITFFLLALSLFGFFIGRNNKDNSSLKTIKRQQLLLGTVVEIHIRSNDEQKADEAINQAFTEIRRIENLFSAQDNQSPIWKINNGKDSIFRVQPEVYNLLILCDSITKSTDGCFDVTIGNLLNIWGFHTENPHLPTALAIDSGLKVSGWNNVNLLGNCTILKKNSIRFDFGAIAKGYAVDKAIAVLETLGIKEALVNAGGEIKVIGKDWKVGIQDPKNKSEIIEIISLDNNSVATSGDYEQFFEVNGIRYHHILDPKTGYPAKGLQSVTIVNNSNTFADALATAVFVLGKERGMKLIETLNDVEGMLIDSEGNIYYSSGFGKFVLK